MNAAGTIVVFAKAPRPGEVKTRMCPPLTPEQAADLYGAMLDDVLAATADFAPRLLLAPVLAVSPPTACALLARRAPPPFRVVPQRGASLSQRMEWALREALATGAQRVLLRGSDSPTLTGDDVAAALSALADHDLALRPDRDGGYTLVGVRRRAGALFSHPMSTGRVLQDTLARARQLEFSAAVSEIGFDLDTVADLSHLVHTHGDDANGICPRTLAWLAANIPHEIKDLS